MLTKLISHERTPTHRDDSTMPFGPRRGGFINAADRVFEEGWPLDEATVEQCEVFDLVYRTLCAVMYNYVPLSGHPGGSISSGRFVARLLFDTMNYDLAEPNRQDADIISYAAGHKALGLYAMWALRNEVARIAAPELLPCDEKSQLRLEDLLGFRRNPTTTTPLFKKFHAKPLDGHPTPATPFVRLSTGASGVGVPASFGLAWAAGAHLDSGDAPRVHIIEGEGGMTPGRVAEAFAAASTASLDNIILHIDWNQASIDSNHVCRDGETPGRIRAMDAGGARVSARLECHFRSRWLRLAADHDSTTPRARFPKRAADCDRLSHSQRLAIRNRRARITWRWSWALLERIFRGGRAVVAKGYGPFAVLRSRQTALPRRSRCDNC